MLDLEGVTIDQCDARVGPDQHLRVVDVADDAAGLVHDPESPHDVAGHVEDEPESRLPGTS